MYLCSVIKILGNIQSEKKSKAGNGCNFRCT